MSSIIVNAQGTTSSSFSIGKRGVVIYQGNISPSDSLGNEGDVFIKRGSDCNILIKNQNMWKPVGEITAKTPQYPYVNKVTENQFVEFSEAEGYLLIDTSEESVTVTLSDELMVSGKRVTIKDIKGDVGTHPITIQTESVQLINGVNTYTIDTPHEVVNLVCDGLDWYTV